MDKRINIGNPVTITYAATDHSGAPVIPASGIGRMIDGAGSTIFTITLSPVASELVGEITAAQTELLSEAVRYRLRITTTPEAGSIDIKYIAARQVAC